MYGTDDHLATVKAANKVALDFNTYMETKTQMTAQAIKSPVYEYAKSKGFSKHVLKQLKQSDMPERLQQETLRQSKIARSRIIELFKEEGDRGYEIFNIGDEIKEEV